MNNTGKLTGNASGDDDDIGAGQSVLETLILGQVACDSLSKFSVCLNMYCQIGGSSYCWARNV